MNKTIVVVGTLVVATTTFGIYLAHRDRLAVRRELALIRGEVAALNALARPNAGGSAPWDSSVLAAVAPAPAPGQDNEDLAKIRRELGSLRESVTHAAELAEAAQSAKESPSAVATDLKPASELKNVGRGTPAASTETALWAAFGGDVDTLAGSFVFSPSARAKADAWFAGLSESSRKEYGSPEKVIALLIARDAAYLSGMQILGEKAISANDVGLRVRIASGEDRVKDETFVMRRVQNDWKMVLPDATVEKFARRLASGK